MDVDVRMLPHHRDVVENSAMPILLDQALIEPAQQPVIEEPLMAPMVTVQPPQITPIHMHTDEFDPDLEFELSAVREDQQRRPAVSPGSQDAIEDELDAWRRIPRSA